RVQRGWPGLAVHRRRHLRRRRALGRTPRRTTPSPPQSGTPAPLLDRRADQPRTRPLLRRSPNLADPARIRIGRTPCPLPSRGQERGHPLLGLRTWLRRAAAAATAQRGITPPLGQPLTD